MIVHPPALRADLLRAQLHLVLLAVNHATDGPWDVGNGCVIGVSHGKPRYPQEYQDYGGALVCESIGRADAVVVAAARNLLPQLIVAYETLCEENAELHRASRWQTLELRELRARDDTTLRRELEQAHDRLRELAVIAAEAARLA